MMTKKERDAALLEIARKTLEIDTLETQKHDRYDFHELAVWTIKQALEQAYAAGERSMVTPTSDRKPADLSRYDLRALPLGNSEYLVERKPKGTEWRGKFSNTGITIRAEGPKDAIKRARECDDSCWG